MYMQPLDTKDLKQIWYCGHLLESLFLAFEDLSFNNN